MVRTDSQDRMKGDEYMTNKIIEVQNIKINITNIDDSDYICISDFGKFKEGKSKADDENFLCFVFFSFSFCGFFAFVSAQKNGAV